MSNRTASHPRLHALIGNLANDVPEDLAREIECALNEQNLPAQAPTFFACLNAIRKGDGADGQPCQGHRLRAGNYASLSRSLAGLTALLDLLQAADRARVDGGPYEVVGDFHIDGIIVAARQLVLQATRSLAKSTAEEKS